MAYQYLLDRPLCCLKTSETNYPGMQHHIPVELLPIIRKATLKKSELVEHVLKIQRKKDE
jgi:hypothetical protein